MLRRNELVSEVKKILLEAGVCFEDDYYDWHTRREHLAEDIVERIIKLIK